MTWSSFAEFAAMGGYGVYVWGSVLVTGGALALELVLLSRRKRAALGAAALAARMASGQAAGSTSGLTSRGRAS